MYGRGSPLDQEKNGHIYRRTYSTLAMILWNLFCPGEPIHFHIYHTATKDKTQGNHELIHTMSNNTKLQKRPAVTFLRLLNASLRNDRPDTHGRTLLLLLIFPVILLLRAPDEVNLFPLPLALGGSRSTTAQDGLASGRLGRGRGPLGRRRRGYRGSVARRPPLWFPPRPLLDGWCGSVRASPAAPGAVDSDRGRHGAFVLLVAAGAAGSRASLAGWAVTVDVADVGRHRGCRASRGCRAAVRRWATTGCDELEGVDRAVG